MQEVGEAVRCVRELEAPSYHHEVVKRAVSASIVDGGPREFELCLQLTKQLCEVRTAAAAAAAAAQTVRALTLTLAPQTPPPPQHAPTLFLPPRRKWPA